MGHLDLLQNKRGQEAKGPDAKKRKVSELEEDKEILKVDEMRQQTYQ